MKTKFSIFYAFWVLEIVDKGVISLNVTAVAILGFRDRNTRWSLGWF